MLNCQENRTLVELLNKYKVGDIKHYKNKYAIMQDNEALKYCNRVINLIDEIIDYINFEHEDRKKYNKYYRNEVEEYEFQFRKKI